MDTVDGSPDQVRARLVRTVEEWADRTDGDGVDAGDWTVRTNPDRVTVELPNRTLVVRRRDGPEGGDRWTLDLYAGGEKVSVFGLFESVDAVDQRVREVLESDVRYTVCCDG